MRRFHRLLPQVNQDIINATEIMSMMLDLTTSGERQLGPVLSLAFKMMRGLTLANRQVQERLFDNLDRILSCKGSSPGWENDMASLIAEIFNDNRDLCIEVKPNQVCSAISRARCFIYPLDRKNGGQVAKAYRRDFVHDASANV